MFWKWLTSDKRVLEALEQSQGYDMSPVIVQAPANTSEAAPAAAETAQEKLALCEEYGFTLEMKTRKA